MSDGCCLLLREDYVVTCMYSSFIGSFGTRLAWLYGAM